MSSDAFDDDDIQRNQEDIGHGELAQDCQDRQQLGVEQVEM